MLGGDAEGGRSALTQGSGLGRSCPLIGQAKEIDDAIAIEFSRGFYDTVAAGKSIDTAVRQGVANLELKGLDSSVIEVLAR